MFFILAAFAATRSFAQLTDTRWGEPINISVLNSSENDFAPSWNKYDGLLYFNSEAGGYSYFYTAGRLDSINFSEPSLLPGEINKKDNNQSFITFKSEDEALFSTYRMTPSRPYLNIFESLRKKKEWTKPFPVDSLTMDSFASHPTISPDGSMMIFSSDRDSKTGETDLWISYLQSDGSWGGVTNLSELNSTGNEITPYLASNDTLYFASDGLGGPGGFDLFVSVRSEGIWQRPFPLTDLNTKYNESDFTMLPGGYGVFASDRPGGKGKLDLYISKSYNVAKKDIYLSDLELSIAVQMQSVKTMSEAYYRNLPLVPYIFTGVSLPQLIRNSGRIYPTVDSVFANTLHILGDRLRQYQSAIFYIRAYTADGNNISINDSLSIKTAEQVKTYLKENENIPDQRILVSTEKVPADILSGSYGVPLIRYDSDEPAIFEPIPIGNRSVIIEPSGLDINVNARPQGMLRDWILGIRMPDGSLDTLESGKKIPASELNIDLKPYSKILAESDSLVLNMICTDTLGNKGIKELIINVAHSELKGNELVKTGDKNFEEYLFFIADGSTITMGNLNAKQIQKIIQSSEYTNGLKVRYFDSNPSTRNNALLLTDELKRKIDNNHIKIETELTPYTGKESFGKQFAPYVLSVLVEK